MLGDPFIGRTLRTRGPTPKRPPVVAPPTPAGGPRIRPPRDPGRPGTRIIWSGGPPSVTGCLGGRARIRGDAGHPGRRWVRHAEPGGPAAGRPRCGPGAAVRRAADRPAAGAAGRVPAQFRGLPGPAGLRLYVRRD